MQRKRNLTDAEFAAWLDTMLNHDGPTQPHMNSPCWEWTALLDDKGYGRSSYREKVISVHRIAWMLANGDPESLCVLHKCDNRKCARIDHLFLGTRADNNADKVAKGRASTGSRNGLHNENIRRGEMHNFHLHPETRPFGDRNGSRRHPETRPRGDQHPWRLHPELVKRGSDNGRARLTEDEVRVIRRLRSEGEKVINLSRRFGVAKSTIRGILDGETWAHVQ